MKTSTLLALMVPMFVAPMAHADDKSACLDAANAAQQLRDAHKLIEARQKLRVCAAAGCPSVVQSDCANWLTQVEKALPAVIATAKDPSGSSLVDVTVTVDGQPFATKLDGTAIPINPGAHSFHFQRADGTSADQQVVVVEGDADQRVQVVLGAKTLPDNPPTGEPDKGSGGFPWRTVGWGVGAAGVVGLGVGTIFGVVAMGDNSSAHCNAANQCQPGPLSSARSAALVSDIGFIAGGVLLAGGVALVLWGPKGGGTEAPAASAAIVPVFQQDGAGLAATGRW